MNGSLAWPHFVFPFRPVAVGAADSYFTLTATDRGMGEDASLDDFLTTDESEEREADQGDPSEQAGSAERSSAEHSSGQRPREDGDTASQQAVSGEPMNESDASAEPDAATGATEPADTATEDGTEVAATTTETGEPARAATTYAWDGAGETCGACGETVERRWQQAGELVCAACKDWEQA